MVVRVVRASTSSGADGLRMLGSRIPTPYQRLVEGRTLEELVQGRSR